MLYKDVRLAGAKEVSFKPKPIKREVEVTRPDRVGLVNEKAERKMLCLLFRKIEKR